MKYIIRTFCILRLVIQKIILRKRLLLKAPVHSYDISNDTHIKCNKTGIIRLGRIKTESNVHIVAWGGKLTIGDRCGLNRNDIIVTRHQIIIGEGTVLGPNVCIYDHNHRFGANGKIDGEYDCAPVIIGRNVWIGAGTVILKGAKIGDNCVIGAGCVVTQSIPNNSLVKADNRNLKIEQLHRNES